MITPFPVADAMDRLSALSELRLVGTASDLQTAIESQPAAVPAAYVLVQERGREPEGASGGLQIQKIDVALQVVLFVRNAAHERTGSAARKDMDALAIVVDNALINWTPGKPHDPLWFTSGRDEKFKPAQLIHQRVYATKRSNRTPRIP